MPLYSLMVCNVCILQCGGNERNKLFRKSVTSLKKFEVYRFSISIMPAACVLDALHHLKGVQICIQPYQYF